MTTLSIDIGGTKTTAALVDDDSIIEVQTWPSPAAAEQAIASIVGICRPWVSQATLAGVSFGGPFDFGTQCCVRSMHTTGWDGMHLSSRLERELDLPVVSDNDANVAALGEYVRIDPEMRDPMLYVTLSTGVGAAIVIDGKLLRGAHSLAGELGHLPIGHDKRCNCGQTGCLERAVSGYWIERDYGQPASEYLLDPHHHSTWVAHLARGLWSATVLVDPASIVIGGGMSSQGDRLIEPLRAGLTSKAQASHRTPPALHLGDPSGHTVLLGAAIMAREAMHGSR